MGMLAAGILFLVIMVDATSADGRGGIPKLQGFIDSLFRQLKPGLNTQNLL